MKTIHRLNRYLELRGIAPKAFEEACGLSNGNFGKKLSRDTPVNSDILAKISELYPELSLVWLITGKGYMYTNPPKTSKEDELGNQRLEEEHAIYDAKNKAEKLIQQGLNILKSISPEKRGTAVRKRKG